MAKRDINRNGKYVPRRKKIGEILSRYYETENGEKSKKTVKKLGIRQQAINGYKSRENKQDAYKIVEEYNKKIGHDVYTKDMVDSWIEAYIDTIKQKENDDAR